LSAYDSGSKRQGLKMLFLGILIGIWIGVPIGILIIAMMGPRQEERSDARTMQELQLRSAVMRRLRPDR